MRKVIAGLSVLVLVLAGLGIQHERSASAARHRRDLAQSEQVARAFLAAWQAKKYDAMGPLTAADPTAGDSFSKLAVRLKATAVTVTPGSFTKNGTHLTFHVAMVMKDLGDLAWDNALDTTKVHGQWKVRFTSATVYPGLKNGQQVHRSNPLVSRGELVDRHATPIRANSADLASNVLGSFVPPLSGLERISDAQLAGTSGGSVEIVSLSDGSVVSTIKAFPAHTATRVVTTLDLPMQQAADAALASVRDVAELVAIDTDTGEVRAVANSPIVGLPTAFSEQAPGSTFKIVVAAAALEHGLTLSTVVPCPPSAIYGGKKFVNDEPLPPRMTFATAFALSCNTAFLWIADTKLPKGSLRALAPSFGFDQGDLLPVAGHGGSVPPPASTTEAYADVIGQGRVQASPLLEASMAAAVASGSWRMPHLFPGVAAGRPLPPAIVAPLQQLMLGVVTSGTAASAGLPAGTHGKTGTAQFGTGNPLPNHAWFTGYLGHLAFCVYVRDGDTGGKTAAPVAARFLRAIA